MAKKYFFGYFIFDCLACIPIVVFEASNGFSNDKEEKLRQIDLWQY